MDESLLCLYIAPRSERLKKHIEIKHLGLRLACDLCDYTSTESSNLKKHRERIHESVKYPCEECDRIFLDKYYLKRHMNNIHLKLPRPVLFCDDCGKNFTHKDYLKKHKTIHLGISYPCEKCEFKTNSKDNLWLHDGSSWRERMVYMQYWWIQRLQEGSPNSLRISTRNQYFQMWWLWLRVQ